LDVHSEFDTLLYWARSGSVAAFTAVAAAFAAAVFRCARWAEPGGYSLQATAHNQSINQSMLHM
jgi:hypothetical protein